MNGIDPDYLEKVRDAVEFPMGIGHTEGDRWRVLVALLVQQNLLLTRVFDMLRIAVGLTEENLPQSTENLDNPTDEKAGDAVQPTSNIRGTVCGRCQKGVVPDSMGYCPACRNDLRTQVQMEFLNRKG
jgi:hypothetical protein